MTIVVNRLFYAFLISAFPLLAQAQTGPGGVGNSSSNKIWLQADDGIIDATPNARIGRWVDQSGNGLDATQSQMSNQPTYQIDGLNGKPYIHFDRSSAVKYFLISYPSVGAIVSNSNTIFIVGKANSGGADNSTNAYQSFLTIPGYHSGIGTSGYPDVTKFFMTNWLGSSVPGTAPTNSVGSSPSMTQGAWSLFSRKMDESSGGTSLSGYVNGTLGSSSSGELQMTNYTQNIIRIGAGFTSGNYTWALNGDIAEIIVYNKALNEAERILVDNYLSSKYNHAIDNDKYSFDASNAHPANVAGIGREDASNQHLSATSNLINIANPSDLNDGEYILLGHNDQPLLLNNSDAPAGKKRLDRLWRADVTGDPGTVSISFTVDNFRLSSGQAFYLLVDNNGLFSDATEYLGTLSNGVFTVTAPVSLNDGDFLTLSYGESGPAAPISLSYEPSQQLYTYGNSYTSNPPFANDGGATPTFSLVNPPTGVSISATAGTISVGPNTPAGNYSLDVVVSNAYGSSTFADAYSFTIYPFIASRLTYSSQTVSLGNAIDPIFSNLPVGLFQYAIASGSLNSLTLNSATGEISGSLQSESTVWAYITATPVGPNASGSPVTGAVVVSAIGSSGPAGVGSSAHNRVWLDANSLTGFTSGARLTSWVDRSGNGWHAVQNTSARKPTYLVNQLNGKPVIRFDRSGGIQYLELTASGVGAVMSNSNTIFTIAKANSAALDNNTNKYQTIIAAPGYHSGISFSGYPTMTGTFIINYVGGTVPGNYTSTFLSHSGVFSQGTWQLISRTISETSTTIQRSFLNSIEIAAPAMSNVQMNTYNTNMVRIGSALPSGSSSWPLNGDLAEIIVYSTALNDAQRVIVENSLSSKYALAIANDLYTTSDLTHTLDVEGIGTTDGTRANKHSIASNGKGLKLEEANTSLNQAREFLFAGHASTSNALVNTDLPANVSDRWERTWFVEKTGTVDVKLSFDLSEGGVTASADLLNEVDYYKLLFRSTSSGSFTVVPVNALLTNDDQLSFTLSDSQLTNGYYTLGNSQGLVWTGAQDRDWNKPGNWSLNRVPTMNDKVVINACTTCPVVDNAVVVSGLILNSGSKLVLGNYELVVSGTSFLNETRIESNNGKILSADFIEVKSSVFPGTITLEKTGGSPNTWYGGNSFSPQLKIINSSGYGLQLSSQTDNVITNF